MSRLHLVVIELKNPADENATINSAFRQIQTYKQAIPGIFTFNCFILISDGLEAKAGTLSSEFTRFMASMPSNIKIHVRILTKVAVQLYYIDILSMTYLKKKYSNHVILYIKNDTIITNA